MANIQEEIEDKVIDCINSGAGGRLVIFKPEKPGKDLIVEKRGDYGKKTVSLKIFQKESNALPDFKIFEEENSFYLVFVNFNAVKQDIEENLWVVPSARAKEVSQDKDFANFLVKKENLGMFFIEIFEKK